MPERNRLGLSLAASIVAHITFLTIFALIAGQSAGPLVPKAKKLVIELFERPQSNTGEKAPEETKRMAPKSNKVKKEAAPKVRQKRPQEQKPVQVQKTPTSSPPLTEGLKPVEKIETLLPKEKKFEEKIQEQKPLPTIEELIPSYNYLARNTPSATYRDVEEGNEISLNTTEFKYVSYFSKLKDKIQMVWKYPEAAKLAGLQGRLTLKFILKSDGSLKEIKIVNSSGVPILDDEAVKAVERAAPFYAIPENLGNTLNIVADFEYHIDYYNVR